MNSRTRHVARHNSKLPTAHSMFTSQQALFVVLFLSIIYLVIPLFLFSFSALFSHLSLPPTHIFRPVTPSQAVSSTTKSCSISSLPLSFSLYLSLSLFPYPSLPLSLSNLSLTHSLPPPHSLKPATSSYVLSLSLSLSIYLSMSNLSLILSLRPTA